ncbi:MAG TPA: hypothetical protein VHZ98_13585 [Galbitalea sp.]|jgi:hypothetical protein|nr:hypothetical protein [Galbitalea sp.]
MTTASRLRLSILLLGAAVLATGSLAGCAPASTATVAGSSPAASNSSGSAGASPGSAGKPSCDQFTVEAFKALVNVPIGTPFIAGSDSAGGIDCWYGIGKNAGVTGSKVETLEGDNILITVIGVDGASQYAHFTGSDVNLGAVTPLSGIGDKASYNVSELSGGVPQLYSVKGDKYCGIQLNVDASELVDTLPAAIAKNEGALCEDAFNH